MSLSAVMRASRCVRPVTLLKSSPSPVFSTTTSLFAPASFAARRFSTAPHAYKGFISVDQLRDAANDQIDTVIVGFTDVYGRLLGKRCDVDFFLDSVEKDGTHACDYLLTCDMDMNPQEGFKFASWHRGYGDMHLVPDLGTLRVASWLNRTALVICDAHHNDTHKRVEEAPRSVLRRQIEAAGSSGHVVQAASELEYYLFKDSYETGAKSGYAPHAMTKMGWYVEDYHILQATREETFNAAARKHLKLSGIPVETSKAEAGPGQHELNTKYSDVLRMADNHVVYKQCLKEIALDIGVSVTFMAKYYSDKSGSGCHIHLSLEKDGVNAFQGALNEGENIKCSELFRYFLGGWIKHTPDVMVFYAPNPNSYRRYQSQSWAPTKLAWSYDNRTAGFRVVGSGSSLRIECRIPGADCNPYLAFAASLASGLDGVKNKIEPPPVFTGDVYEARQLPSVPSSLGRAVEVFKNSEFARNAFGSDVVDHYAHFYALEDAAAARSVTDWERSRYFESV